VHLHNSRFDAGLHFVWRQPLYVRSRCLQHLLCSVSMFDRFHFMDPKVGYFRRMKSYHINHHYKNVELGPSSPCCKICTLPFDFCFFRYRAFV
jgi:hypothetical protein